MSRGQIFGTIIDDSFLKDDQGNLRRYDRNVVIRGKPEFNDTLVFEQNRSKTITKIWLLKELDNEVEVKTEPTVSPVAASRPVPSIYEDSPADITVRKPEIPKRPIPKPRVSENNEVPSSYINNGTFNGNQAVARQNVYQPIQSGAQGSSTDNQPTPRQKFELLFKGGLSSQSKANDTGKSVMKGYSTEARQSPINPFSAAAVLPQKRQQNPSVRVDVSKDSDDDDSDDDDSGDDESEEKEENPGSSNHAGVDNDANKNSANKDKKNTKKGKEKKKNNRNAEGNKNKNQNNPNKYQNNNGSTQNLRSKTNTAPAEKKKRVFHTGYVTNFIRKDDKPPFGFIRCKDFQKDTMNQEVVLADVNEVNDRDNDVFFPFDNVQSNLLDLMKGDDVEFHTFTNNKNSNSKHKAAVVKVVRLNRRSYQDLLSYVTMVKDLVAPQLALDNCIAGFESDDEFDYFGGFSSDEDEAHFRRITRREESGKQKPKHDPSSIMKLVADPTVWQMITEQISNLPNGDTLLCLLLEVVSFLHKARRTLEERFRQVLVSITSSSKFFNPIKGRLLGFIKTSCASNTNVKLMQDFLLLVAQLVPEKRPAIIAFIKPMMEKPGEDTAAFLYMMLKTLSSGSSESIADLDWRDLPLILKKEEIFEPNFTQMMNIRPVQVRGNYDCADDYMDVYFRLLREDCFSQLKKCIRQLLDGKLDTRDMNVYKNVALVGISLKDNSLYLALRVISLKEIRDWDTSSSLMFGNLLCISIGGSFQKPIWVTVASREMLKKDSIVIVQSCWEWNDVDDAEILLNLITSKGSVWMVESPTYYRAFQPVLQSLQQLDANSISFKDELVDLQPGPLPDFLHESSDFDAYLVHKVPKQGRITVKDFLNTPHSNNSVFDKSQEEAVKNALKNRIGIIQGPPGCGKSFIGVKMLQLLLSLSSLEDPKVLVLTYKNHALDEFLKGTMKIIGNENVVRIGGRCKDPELDNISLGTCKKNSKLKPEFRDQIMGLKDYIDEAKEQITSQFKSLNKLRNFKYEMLWSHLSQEQVHSLLIHCPWDDLKVFLNFGDDIDDQGFTKQKNKRNRQTKMTKQKVKEVLNSNKWEKYTESFLKLNKEALKCWMPSEKDFDDFESLLIGTKATTVKLKIPTKQELKEIKEKAKGKNGQVEDDEKGLYEIEDQQEIEDEQRERMSAITKTNFAVKSDFQKTLQMVDYKDEDQEDKGYTIKAFSSGALQKLEEMDAAVLMNLNDLWEMSKEERIKFTQMIVHRETKEVREEFQKQLHSYEEFSKQKAEIENQRTAGILKEKKVIGVTITGASINKQLLKEIQPEIVIVEEAAEVLEPQLLASIGTWTKYMLLIGDHQQLRPSVDSYELRKNYNFDLSMMERLINNNMSFKTLQMQNRQRVEFAELLFDIYPGLKTNHERVKNNEPATCLQKSSFFWHHAELESKDRSVTNPEEAKRAVKLALFLVQQGYKADKITILATYRGQTALIRKTLREYEKNYAHLIKEDVQISEMEIANAARGQKKEQTAKDSIKVHTVDMYQGDENDFVIVSLVRSNETGKIGFLSEMNRRCVAQSRARCGVYFIGNANMFINNKTWRYLIQNLKNDRRLSDNISLLCKRHPEIPCPIKNSDALTLESFCMVDCGLKMHCGKHPCLKKCQPPHNHRPCKEKVAFVHLTCGHKDTRFCEEDERNKKCKASVPFRFPKCGHLGEKKCFEDINSISCTQMEIVDLKCGHRKMKMCFQNIDDVKCEEICMQKLNPCGHLCSGHKCFEHASQKTCMTCKKQQEAELALQRKKEKQAREEYDAKIDIQIKRLQKEARLEKGVEYIPLFPQNETHAEYLEVEDLVKKYVQPGHNWYPTIKEISKVVNREMRIRFLKCSTMLFDSEPRVTYKFHGTDDKGVDGITKNGFRLPSTPGMYGAGIYLATDSSKSAQTIYTKGSNKLIVCEVYLGKSYVVKHAEDTLNAGKLKALKFDSVFAPRDTKGTGGVLFDEFVVFNIDQVFPKYIIHYTKHQFSVNKIPLNVSFKSTTFAQGKKTMKSKRQVDMSDPLEAHFAFVESRFLRMLNRKGVKHEITDIDVYMNPQLEAKFDAKVAEFKQKYPRSSDSEPIYGFHGTKSSQVVDSIMDNNFNRSNQGKFGAGVYFSEQPSYTFNYGGQNHLIMARILPGKTRECQNGWSSGGCTPGYDSHAGFKQPDGTFDEVVIFNTEQILPCYVIHFK